MRQLMIWMLVCITGSLHAQSVITGTVTNKTNGQPLTGVSIILQEKTQSGVLSDTKGNYKIILPAKGNYTLAASYLGFKTFSIPVTAGSPTTVMNIILEETGLFVKPVEISSLRVGKNAPFTQSTLNAEDIKKDNMGQDLPILLNQLPSVVTNSDAGTGIGYTGMRVRGSDITRINVTVNGIPINDAESQGTFFVNMPDFASSTNSIQLQRGVGTSTNGAGAFGASLNLSTNEFREQPYAEINNSYGSFNSWKHTVKAGSGLINNHFTLDARLSKISSDGYIDRATSDLHSFYTSAAYIAKKTAIRLNVFSGKEKTYQAWNGVPEDLMKTDRTYNSAGTEKPGTPYDNETDNYQQDHYQLFLNQEINSNLNFNVAFHMTRGRGYYEQYKAKQLYTEYGLPKPVINTTDTIYTTDLVRQLWLDNYFYGGIFSVNRTGKKLNWSLGGGWNRYEGGHYGKIIWAEYGIDKDHKYYNYPADKNDLNIYWKGDFKITESIRLFADMQYRTVQYNMNGFEDAPLANPHKSYHFFNPKAGVYYTINPNNQVYVSFAISNKEPNRTDFEVNLTGTAPKPEMLRNVEAGYTFRTAKTVIEANVYYMNYKDQLVQTGKLNNVGAYVRTNIQKSYRMGVELQGSTRLGNYCSLSVNAALSQNKIPDFTAFIMNYDTNEEESRHFSKTDIAFSPNAVAGYTFTVTPVKNLDISVIGKYVSKQYMDNTSNKASQLDAYYVNNLRFIYLVPQPLFKELGLQFALNNVFDTKYSPNGATFPAIENGVIVPYNYYYPMAGINFFAGVNISF
jgi:iron complex outermembrane receptor protein